MIVRSAKDYYILYYSNNHLYLILTITIIFIIIIIWPGKFISVFTKLAYSMRVEEHAGTSFFCNASYCN